MTTASKPNVLLLFTDMQRFDTIHALGNPTIKTPNLDRLVREGTCFTSAYSPCPVCVPARWCMHHGQYTSKSGLFTNGVMPRDNGNSLPAMLKQMDYKTMGVGKCHFTPDKLELRGFDARLVQEECCSEPDSDDLLFCPGKDGKKKMFIETRFIACRCLPCRNRENQGTILSGDPVAPLECDYQHCCGTPRYAQVLGHRATTQAQKNKEQIRKTQETRQKIATKKRKDRN